MNLYLIKAPEEHNDYDTYDSAVVCAENEDEARLIHPSGREWDGTVKETLYRDEWVNSTEVIVKQIGVSIDDKKGVICASYNAG